MCYLLIYQYRKFKIRLGESCILIKFLNNLYSLKPFLDEVIAHKKIQGKHEFRNIANQNEFFMRMRITFLILSLLITNFITAQKLVNSDYGAYIAKYKSIAIREMKLYKIPASITLAQGMIESGCGKSVLAIETSNHFGIKCQKDWLGDTYLYDDDREKECFRKYRSVDESFRDHSLFLTTRSRYSELFTLPLNDYKGWARGLKKAGYATNPDYPNILIRLIEANNLNLLDDSLLDTEDYASNEPAEEVSHSRKRNIEKSHHRVNGATYDANQELNQAITNEKNSVNNEGRILYRKYYSMPAPSGFKSVYTSNLGRKVYENYGVPFIFANKDDSWYSIAKEFKILIFQVYRQNDLRESDKIIPGQMLYLESKKRKNTENTYKVKKGDSMYSISQEKCIKLPLLLKYNQLELGDEPNPGFVLNLKR